MAGETPNQKLAYTEGMKLVAPLDSNGLPMTQITCGAAELIPTVQYGNVTIGPVGVTRWVPVDCDLKAEIASTQALCEQAVAEDRETVHALTRQSEQGRFTQ